MDQANPNSHAHVPFKRGLGESGSFVSIKQYLPLDLDSTSNRRDPGHLSSHSLRDTSDLSPSIDFGTKPPDTCQLHTTSLSQHQLLRKWNSFKEAFTLYQSACCLLYDIDFLCTKRCDWIPTKTHKNYLISNGLTIGTRLG